MVIVDFACPDRLTEKDRNFNARNDANRTSVIPHSSPTIVTAMAFSGKLSFKPTKDELITLDGSVSRFTPPGGETLPAEELLLVYP